MALSTFFKKAEDLLDQVEMGLMVKSKAYAQIRSLRSDLADSFGEGTDEFVQGVETLIDIHSLVETL